MKYPNAKRKWMFTCEDFDDNTANVDSNGREIDESEAKNNPFIGDNSEALKEAEIRADKWEELNGCFCSKVIHYSLGLIEPDAQRSARTGRGYADL